MQEKSCFSFPWMSKKNKRKPAIYSSTGYIFVHVKNGPIWNLTCCILSGFYFDNKTVIIKKIILTIDLWWDFVLTITVRNDI